MSESVPPPRRGEERLVSWKEIARYLDTAPRTVMRWQDEGLPVHRLLLNKRPTVYAYKSELDRWMAERSATSPQARIPETPKPPRRAPWLIPAAAALTVVALFGVGLEREPVSARTSAGEFVGEHTQLTDWEGLERSPAVSPDGARAALVEVSEDGLDFDIALVELASGERSVIAQTNAAEFSPAWSPDGERIAYVRTAQPALDNMRRMELVVAAVSRPIESLEVVTGLAPVLHYHNPFLLGPVLCWTSDGESLIVAISTIMGPGNRREERGLFELNLSSGERRRLTTSPQGIAGDLNPSLSPDGRSLVFIRRFAEFHSDAMLMSLDRPSEAPRQLTHFGNVVLSPRFSPAGDAIYVSAGQLNAERNLWRIDPAGAAAPQTVGSFARNLYDFDLYQAEGETRLVYTRGRLRSGIWSLEPGSEPSRYAAARYSADRLPALSHDGTQVAFLSDRGGSTEIWRGAFDTAYSYQLTSGLGDVRSSLDWSPDGKWLTTSSRRGAARNIFKVDASKGTLTQLTTGQFLDRAARWSPDGQWVYFSSNRDQGLFRMYRVPADGGEVESAGPGMGLDFPPDGAIAYRSFLSLDLRLERPDGNVEVFGRGPRHGLAPTAKGLFHLTSGGKWWKKAIVFRSMDGRDPQTLHTIENSNWDLTADREGKLIMWSQHAGQEGDLMAVTLE